MDQKACASNDAPELSGCRILIVEDEIMQALAIGELVAELGCTVCAVAYRPEQALEALDKFEIDCALLDVNLGGTLSYPIAAEFRRRHIPFLYCTAYVDATSVFPPVAAAPRLGKPVQKDDLRDMIIHVLNAEKS
jgi:CheY-like chemotaxis protein